jgi:tRNA nucleotidyltransferase (CCA-adding enzyme)
MNSVIKAVLEQFKAHGFDAYVVGGFVRDYLLGIESSDVDITTNATPDQVKALFDRTVDIGIQHGSVKVLFQGQEFDITTFRQDGEYTNHRHPESVTYGVSLEDDVTRRDFTMNALAMDLDGRIIDVVNGQLDITSQVIRAIGDPSLRMQEDALRIVRALRFVSVLGFRIDDDLLDAMKQHQHLVANVSVERVQHEVQKWLKGFYIRHANTYLSQLKISYLPSSFVDDSSLTLIEQLAIAEINHPGISDKYALTKKERKLLSYLLSLAPSLPSKVDLYTSLDVTSMIRVGHYVFGWDSTLLKQMNQQLLLHSRDQLAIRGDEIQVCGFHGPEIEEVLQTLERLVLEETLANDHEVLLQYVKGIANEN